MSTETMTHPYRDESGRFEKVAEAYPKADYNWRIAVVWRDTTTGRLYGDSDSGCSCYGPFEENPDNLGDLVEITSREQASDLSPYVLSTTERLDFLRAVDVALAGVTA